MNGHPALYKLYIFDFDFTLFDTSEGTIHCVNAAFAACGISEVSEDEIRRGIGLPLREFFARYTHDAGTIEHMERTFLQRSADTMVELSVPFGNTVFVVRELSARGSKLAVCTGKYRDRVWRTLARYSIEGCFDTLVCGDEITKQKPDPEGLIRCMAQFDGVAKEEIVYVGDHPYDVIAAQNCGVDSIAVASGSTPVSELEKYQPTYMINDLIELL